MVIERPNLIGDLLKVRMAAKSYKRVDLFFEDGHCEVRGVFREILIALKNIVPLSIIIFKLECS